MWATQAPLSPSPNTRGESKRLPHPSGLRLPKAGVNQKGSISLAISEWEELDCDWGNFVAICYANKKEHPPFLVSHFGDILAPFWLYVGPVLTIC